MVVVRSIEATDTHVLRRAVLRDGWPTADVSFDEDAAEGTFHLGAFDGDDLVGIATFVPVGASTWQLRGMAVDPDHRGTGVGRAVLDAGVARVRAAGGVAMWAHGRDGALGFYGALGWVVVGDGYLTPTGLPHHRIELDLR